MKVKITQTAGFCWGVKKAVDLVLQSAQTKKGPIYTWGPLIHNQQVIQNLQEKNIYPTEELEKVSGHMVVIRTHGVTPAVRQSFHKVGAEVIDATCPHVKKVQEIISQHQHNGYTMIIIGDKGHAEATGLLGFTNGKGYLINQLEEVKKLPPLEKVCVVAQTTQRQELFDLLSKEISSRVKECKIFNTICNATRQRQEETIKLAQEVDILVVVGDRHSANTNRLVQLSQNSGTKAILVETETNLNKADFADVDSIGLAAGASTPTWLINRVLGRIRGMKKPKALFLIDWFKDMLALMVQMNLYLALGAGALTFTCSKLQGIPFSWSYLVIAALFVLSMQILNRLADKSLELLKNQGLTGLSRWSYSPLLIIGLTAGSGALLISVSLGIMPFLILLLALLAGAFYSMEIVPQKWIRPLGLRRLRDIPASKEIAVALAWGIIAVVLPWLATREKGSIINLLVFAYAFLLVIIRSTIVDVKEVERDRIVGREIILKVLGKAGTTVVLVCLILLLSIVSYKLSLITVPALLAWSQFGVILYIIIYNLLYYRRILSGGVRFELVVDAQFLLTALLVSFPW